MAKWASPRPKESCTGSKFVRAARAAANDLSKNSIEYLSMASAAARSCRKRRPCLPLSRGVEWLCEEANRKRSRGIFELLLDAFGQLVIKPARRADRLGSENEGELAGRILQRQGLDKDSLLDVGEGVLSPGVSGQRKPVQWA